MIRWLLKRQERATSEQATQIAGVALVASAGQDLQDHKPCGRKLLAGFDRRPEA